MYFRVILSLVFLAKPLWVFRTDCVLFLLDSCQTCMHCNYDRDVPLDFLEILNASGCDSVAVDRTGGGEPLAFTILWF